MSESTPLSEQAQVAEAALREMLRQMEFPAPVTIDVSETPEQITLAMHSEQPLGVLIGKGGQTLNALELLVTLIARHKTDAYGKRVVLDAEGYRGQQTGRIEEIARAAAHRVLESGENVELEPMNARDRRTAHMAISEIEGVSTVSIGEEPYRRLVVSLPGQEPVDA
ncbi:MAG TPA: R3H domain-containing nucleic acid-binding protein [Armatimonadota bacterium]|jgi:spoIIIJ-associated protein